MDEDLTEITLSAERLYKGKIIDLELSEVRLPNGRTARREAVRHPGGAAVLLVKDGMILMERQFRFPYGKIIWEIPAGKLNSGEDPCSAALRELEEETGWRAKKLERLAEIYPSPGYTDEIIYIFFATEAEFSRQHPDDDEFVNCRFIDIDECIAMCENGEISDAKTLVALYKYAYDSNKKKGP